MLNANVITAAILANRGSGVFAMAGVNFDQLASGIGLSVSEWGVGNQQSNLGLTGATSGLVGSGVVGATKLIIPPTIPIMVSALVSAGMVSQLSQSLAMVVTLGISQSFTASGQYVGVSAGVGVGSDVSKITTVNVGALMNILKRNLSVILGQGSALDQMVIGLSIGITNLLLTGTGFGSVTGVAATASTVGTSVSGVI